MTVFERIRDNITIDAMAELGVKLISVNNKQLYYLTSSGQLFDYTRYGEALNHEYQWLAQELPSQPDVPQSESEPEMSTDEE